MGGADLSVATLALARRISDRLSGIGGVVAVAIGGSWARGGEDAHSDLDLGVYYEPSNRPSLASLSDLARELDDRRPKHPLTEFGAWGPWIDGGGWLLVEGRRVDWIYRDLDRVAKAIEDAIAGRVSPYYQPGHPHAFHTHIYAGEIHHARILHDRHGRLAALQARTRPYPPALRRAILDAFLWEAGFALETSEKSAARGDVAHVSGCLFRSAACMVQVLFAINERWFVNEKRSLEAVQEFALRPSDFAVTVREILARTGTDAPELLASLRRMRDLVRAVEALAG